MNSEPVFVPAKLSNQIRQNTRRSAECLVYDTLKAQLKGPWAVYYSRPWLGLTSDGLDKEGEADFVLAHPELGLLVIEVKGGRIAYRGDRDQWTTTGRDGFTNYLSYSPAVQANRSKHALLDKLDKLGGRKRGKINACIAVIFPNCSIPGDLSTDLPRFAIAGVGDMASLGQWVEQRLSGSDEKSSERLEELGQDGMKLLHELLAPSFSLEQPLAATLLSVEQEMNILTEQQAMILQLLDSHSRLAIPGLAGTGKTSLAIKKARALADGGARTLLLCHNRALAAHIRASMKVHPRLDISTLPAFVNRYAREAGLPAMPKGREDTESMQEQLALVCSANPDLRYDALIVDEGQDFGATLLGSLQNLLRDPDGGTFYCFYDDNQKVQLGGAAIAQLLPKSPMALNRILRNTRNIVDSYRGLLPRHVHSEGPQGPDTEFRAPGDPAVSLRAVLQQLIEQQISPNEIAVLAPDSAWLDAAGGSIGLREGEFADAENLPDDRVVLDTVRRFKGLEKKVVVLVAPSAYAFESEMLYVAMSRARALLILVDTVAGITLVKSALKES